jgi:hypothetical protein
MAAACILMISTDLYQCEPQQEHASKSFSCAIGPTRPLKEEDHGLLLLLQGSYGSYVLTSTYCLSKKKKKPLFREFLLFCSFHHFKKNPFSTLQQCPKLQHLHHSAYPS